MTAFCPLFTANSIYKRWTRLRLLQGRGLSLRVGTEEMGTLICGAPLMYQMLHVLCVGLFTRGRREGR